MTSEQANPARQNLDRSCWIRHAPDRIVDALLLEISHSGARLGLRQAVDLPAQFDLLLTRDGKVGRRAAIVSKKAHEIEVRFLSRTIPIVVESERDEDSETDAGSHVVKL
jgi:hypothetical protein